MTGRALQVVGAIFKHVGIGLAVTVGIAIPWSAIAVINLRFSPHVPWAIPVGVAYVCLAMSYLNGGGWPKSTSAARKRNFRAQPLVLVGFSWALLAGLAAVTSLWLCFAASGNLSAQAPQGSQPDWPPIVLLGAVIISAAVTAISEEGGLRGFMQAPLEGLLGPAPAIATTSLLFVLIHLSHGVTALARYGLFYLAAGCVYGLLAYLTQSILPSLLLHFLGDIITFGLRSALVHLSGPHNASARALLVLAALFVACFSGVAFLRLARLTIGKRSRLRTETAPD